VTTQQTKTLKRLGVALALQVATIGWLLYTEFAAVAQGGNSTISELAWIAFANQPGAVFGVLMPLTASVAYLAGHLLWQNSGKYREMRGEK
jgi:threonine/homoserine efflux transporter RhtA